MRLAMAAHSSGIVTKRWRLSDQAIQYRLCPASRYRSAAASASAWVSNRRRSRVPSGAMASKVIMRRCSWPVVGLLGTLALLEGAVGDPLKQLGVMLQGPHV